MNTEQVKNAVHNIPGTKQSKTQESIYKND